MVVTGSAEGWWPPSVRRVRSSRHPLSGEGLGQADALAAGLAEVGVVQEPVDGGGGGGQGLGMSSSNPEG